MAEPPLEPHELEAIQAAIQEARSTPTRNPSPAEEISEEDVAPLALIADDRAAEIARPAALGIAEKWAEAAQRRLRPLVQVELHVVTAETIDGTGIRDEIGKKWLASIDTARPAPAMLAVGGSMVELLAARLLGAPQDDEESRDGRPTSTAIEVFTPIGSMFADALKEAWYEEQAYKIQYANSGYRLEETRRAICDAEVIIATTVSVSGAVEGRLRLFCHPAALVTPTPEVEAVPASPDDIRDALGAVELDVKVEFGKTSLSMSDLRSLKVGTVIPLTQFVDDLLPVECAGVIKAYGRPVVYRGVLAVQVEATADAMRRSEAA